MAIARVIKTGVTQRNTRIGTARFSNPTSQYNNAVADLGSFLSNEGYQKAKSKADKAGKKAGIAVESKDLAIDPKTGKPIAYSTQLPFGGKIAQESYEETIDRQVLIDYEQKILEKSNKEYYKALTGETSYAEYQVNVSNYAQLLVDKALPQFKEPVLKLGAGIVSQQGKYLLADKSSKMINLNLITAKNQLNDDSKRLLELTSEFGSSDEQVINHLKYLSKINNEFVARNDPSFFQKIENERPVIVAKGSLLFINKEIMEGLENGEFPSNVLLEFNSFVNKLRTSSSLDDIAVKKFNNLTGNKFLTELKVIFNQSNPQDLEDTIIDITQSMQIDVSNLKQKINEDKTKKQQDKAEEEKVTNYNEIGKYVDDTNKLLKTRESKNVILNSSKDNNGNINLDELEINVVNYIENYSKEFTFSEDLTKEKIQTKNTELVNEAVQSLITEIIEEETSALQMEILGGDFSKIPKDTFDKNLIYLKSWANEVSLNKKEFNETILLSNESINNFNNLVQNIKNKYGNNYDSLIKGLKSSLFEDIKTKINIDRTKYSKEITDKNDNLLIQADNKALDFIKDFNVTEDQKMLIASGNLNLEELFFNSLQQNKNKYFEQLENSQTLTVLQKDDAKSMYKVTIAGKLLTTIVSSFDEINETEYDFFAKYIEIQDETTLSKLPVELQKVLKPIFHNDDNFNLTLENRDAIRSDIATALNKWNPKTVTQREQDLHQLIFDLGNGNFKNINNDKNTRNLLDEVIVLDPYNFNPEDSNFNPEDVKQSFTLMRRINTLPQKFHQAINGLVNGETAELSNSSSIIKAIDGLLSMPSAGKQGDNRTLLKTFGIKDETLQKLEAIIDTVSFKNAIDDTNAITKIVLTSLEEGTEADQYKGDFQTLFEEKVSDLLKDEEMDSISISEFINNKQLYFETLARSFSSGESQDKKETTNAVSMFDAFKKNYKMNYFQMGESQINQYGKKVLSDRVLEKYFDSDADANLYKSKIIYDLNNETSQRKTTYILAENYNNRLESISSDNQKVEKFKQTYTPVYLTTLNQVGQPVFTAMAKNAEDNTFIPLTALNKNNQLSLWQWPISDITTKSRLAITPIVSNEDLIVIDKKLIALGLPIIAENGDENRETNNAINTYVDKIKKEMENDDKELEKVTPQFIRTGRDLLKELFKYSIRSLGGNDGTNN